MVIQAFKVLLFSLALIVALSAGLREVWRSDYMQATFYGLLAAVAVVAIWSMVR